jgi:hypothetical protein
MPQKSYGEAAYLWYFSNVSLSFFNAVVSRSPGKCSCQVGAAVAVFKEQACSINHENFNRNPLFLGELLQFPSQLRWNPQFNVHALNRIGVCGRTRPSGSSLRHLPGGSQPTAHQVSAAGCGAGTGYPASAVRESRLPRTWRRTGRGKRPSRPGQWAGTGGRSCHPSRWRCPGPPAS